MNTVTAGYVDVLAGLIGFVGLGLAGYGLYSHFSLAAAVRAGSCDGCAPWHPLLIVAPIVVGSVSVLGTVVYAAYRR
jgi:hypothetical protein